MPDGLASVEALLKAVEAASFFACGGHARYLRGGGVAAFRRPLTE
jgi:hypothetical protein